MGNLTRDPDVRYTPKGTAVGDLGLAVNRRVSDGNGNWSDEVTFVDVTVWGNNAENAQKFLKKGRGVFVEGRLQLDSWEDKESGQKRSKTKVVAEVLQFLPDKTMAESSARARETEAQRIAREEREAINGTAPGMSDHLDRPGAGTGARAGSSEGAYRDEEDDIPF